MKYTFPPINFNLYHYAGNNPVKYTDPDGRIIDTIWDIACTAYDIGSAIYNSSKGDNSGWIDVGIDAAAILIPCVPAGLSKIDDAVRAADKVGDVAKAADNVSDAVKVADKANDLHRPYIRKSTREAVENAAQKKCQRTVYRS